MVKPETSCPVIHPPKVNILYFEPSVNKVSTAVTLSKSCLVGSATSGSHPPTSEYQSGLGKLISWAVVVAQFAEWLLPIPEDPGLNPVISNFY